MTIIRALTVLFFLMITIHLSPLVPVADSVDVPTVGALIQGIQSLLDQLQSLAATVQGDANSTINNATTQLKQLLVQLNGIVANIADPVTKLSDSARIITNQAQHAIESYGPLVDHQRDCIFQNLDMFLAGVKTVTQTLKEGIPGVDSGQPRLVSFRFDSSLTRNVVPVDGGRLTVYGFNLWGSEKPEVSLYDQGRVNVLSRLKPEQGTSADDISLHIDPTIIAAQAGNCLALNVKTFRKTKFLFIPSGSEETANLYIPLCVPEEYGLNLQMTAWVGYNTSVNSTLQLASKSFGWGNSSCENRLDVAPQTLSWSDVIPAGWKIENYVVTASDVRRTTNISITFTNWTISAAGWLDTARCVWLPFNRSKLLSDTHWYMHIAPIIGGPTSTPVTSPPTKSSVVPMQVPATQICVKVPKDSRAAGQSSYWLQVVALSKAQKETLLYRQPIHSTDSKSSDIAISDLDVVGPYRIETHYNPVIVSGSCEVCANITLTNACGF